MFNKQKRINKMQNKLYCLSQEIRSDIFIWDEEKIMKRIIKLNEKIEKLEKRNRNE